MLNELIEPQSQPINASNSEFFQKFDEDLGKDILVELSKTGYTEFKLKDLER